MDFRKVALWSATIFIAAVFLLSAADKVLQPQMWRERFADEWGLPAWMAALTAVVEIVGAVLILMPRRAVYGGTLLAVLMVGAAGTHAMAGQLGNIAVNVMLGGLAAAVAWYRCPWCGGGDT